MVDLTLQLCWMGGTPFDVSLMVWKSVKEGLKQLGRTILQERLWPGKCCTLLDGSQEGMATSMSTHLRSRQCCHFDVEIVNKVGTLRISAWTLIYPL